MERPTGDMYEEIAEILSRDVRKLATARDVPRLCGRIQVIVDGDEVVFDGKKEGSNVTHLLRCLRQVLEQEEEDVVGEDGKKKESKSPEVFEEASADDTVRTRLSHLTNQNCSFLRSCRRELSVLQCLNQNIVAPVLVRLKWSMQEKGIMTRDAANEWRVIIHVAKKKNPLVVSVTHFRAEETMNAPKGTLRWSLCATLWPEQDVVVQMEQSDVSVEHLANDLSKVLEKVENTRAHNVDMPDVSKYFRKSYFSW